MRVSNQMMTRSLLANLQFTTERMAKLQDQISTGKKILRPSDDPGGIRQIASIKSALNDVTQYTANANEASSLLQMTESGLTEINDLLQATRTSALEGATGTCSDQERAALAKVVEQNMQSLVRSANSDRSGRFLFGGYNTNGTPFTLDLTASPPVTYTGDSGVSTFQIGRSSYVDVNLAGDEVFNLNSTATPGTPDIFDTLNQLKNALQSGDTTAIQDCVTQLDTHSARVLNLRAAVGARQQGLALAKDRLASTDISLKDILSKTEDTDMAEAAVNLQSQQNIYQATAAAAGLITQHTLLDYLR
jgi:flagellar hook-associated protein 3 FlgL